MDGNAEAIALERLESQISWYDRRAKGHQRLYKGFKMVQVVSSALVPLFSGLGVSPWIVGSLGVLITMLEGILQINQNHHNWIAYRSTCEALRHEKYLFLVRAGQYRDIESPERLLIEQVESLVSTEHARWVEHQSRQASLRKRDGATEEEP